MKATTQYHLNRIIAATAAILLSLSSFAQEQADSLVQEENPVLKDARSYSMQRRYRAKDTETFKSYKFSDNMFFGFSVGRDNTFRQEFADGAETSLMIGKWFAASHGMKLSAFAATGKDNYDGSSINRYGAKLSYLFDFTHYLWGYNPYRFVDVSSVIGGGFVYQTYKEESAPSWSAHMGLNFSFRAFRNFSFFVEPVFNVASEPGLYKHDVNWRQYVPSLNASAGFTYYIRNKDYRNRTDSERLYFFGGAGLVVHNNFIHRESGMLSGAGASVAAGIGLNCKSWLGFRTSAQVSNCLWDDRNVGLRSNSYFALRMEAVFDVLPSDSKFGIAFFFGPETGFMRKRDKELIINSWYTGATGGLQFRFNLNDNLDLCLEPRASVIPYSAPTDLPAPQKYWERNYYDGIFSLNIVLLHNLKK